MKLGWALDLERGTVGWKFRISPKKDLEFEFSVVRNDFEKWGKRPSKGSYAEKLYHAANLWQ